MADIPGSKIVPIRDALYAEMTQFYAMTSSMQGQIAQLTALIDQSLSTIAIASTDAVKAEGNSGVTTFTFTVTRTGDLSGTTTVSYAVAGLGSTPADANDFGGTFPSGNLSFAPGETAKIITVNVSGDTVVETDETFVVTLSNVVGGLISTATAVGTISNDDVVVPPPPPPPGDGTLAINPAHPLAAYVVSAFVPGKTTADIAGNAAPLTMANGIGKTAAPTRLQNVIVTGCTIYWKGVLKTPDRYKLFAGLTGAYLAWWDFGMIAAVTQNKTIIAGDGGEDTTKRSQIPAPSLNVTHTLVETAGAGDTQTKSPGIFVDGVRVIAPPDIQYPILSGASTITVGGAGVDTEAVYLFDRILTDAQIASIDATPLVVESGVVPPPPPPPPPPPIDPPPGTDFFTRTGTPTIVAAHECAQHLLWDGVDLGVATLPQVVQLVPGAMIIPGFHIPFGNPPHVPAPVEQTPWGPATKWTGWQGQGSDVQQGFNGYGVIGWLRTTTNPDQNDPTDPIRVASILQGKPVGTGFTVACTYRQSETAIGGTGMVCPPLIFGRFLNAGEAGTFASWAFVETGKMDYDFGHGHGSGKQTVGFAWNHNSYTQMIDWTENIPPAGALVTLVATAEVQSDGTSTVKFYGAHNGGAPVLIGSLPGQIINDNGKGNSEDQIGWGGIVHYETGGFSSVHCGNVMRGCFSNSVWSPTAIAAYMANPDCYHAWP